MLPLTEQYLIDILKKGEKSAFEFLFRTYYNDLCKYAFKLVGNDTLAKDLVMDVFVKLWESSTKLNITSSLSGYLYQSVHNHCINYQTRIHNRFKGLDRETTEKLFALLEDGGAADPLGKINLSELRNKIEKSIDQLPEECRKIFIMSRTEEMSHKEIAQVLGISENTVKVQIYRALKKLRILLREFLPESDEPPAL
jgi:RNA polymerase sigma-70 factor (ECF subfamily)